MVAPPVLKWLVPLTSFRAHTLNIVRTWDSQTDRLVTVLTEQIDFTVFTADYVMISVMTSLESFIILILLDWDYYHERDIALDSTYICHSQCI